MNPWLSVTCDDLFCWTSSILHHNKSSATVASQLFRTMTDDNLSVASAEFGRKTNPNSNTTDPQQEIAMRGGELISVCRPFSLPSAKLSRSYQYHLYLFAFNEVGNCWKELGISLDFAKVELDAIDKDLCHLNYQHKAWTMLQRYCDDNGAKDLNSLRMILRDVQGRSDTKKRDAFPMISKSVTNDPRCIGRNSELASIEEFFWQGNQDTARVQQIASRKIQVICGLGGVGKTSLAFRYADRFRQAYSDGIFHFNAESPATLHTSLDENVRMIEMLSKKRPLVHESSQFSDQLVYFWRYLRSNSRSLLIFDSADHLDWTKDAIPHTSVNCHLIITTRKSPEHLVDPIFKQPGVSAMKLLYLQEEFATRALLAWSGKDPDQYDSMSKENQYFVQEIALKPPVEGLPIAIAHAGAFIQIHKLTFSRYWQIMVERVRELKAAALDLDKCLQYFRLTHLKRQLQRAGVSEPEDLKILNIDEFTSNSSDRALLFSCKSKLFKRSLAFLTWEMDIDEVERKSREGYAVLSCCSIFSSRDIPHSLVEKSSFPDSEAVLREYYMALGLGALNKFSLIHSIEQNDGLMRYDVHHLIQSSMVQRCMENVEEFKRLLNTAARFVLAILPKFEHLTDHLNNDSTLLSVSSHVYSIARHMLQCGMTSEAYPDVVDYGCGIALAFQHLHTAKELCSLRLRNFEKSNFGAEKGSRRHKQYSYDLGEVYKDLKLYDKAEQCYLQAIENKCPDEMPTFELAQNWFVADRLAVCRLGRGAHQEAEKLFLRIIDALVSTGSDLRHVSTVQNNLAAVYKTSGQLQQLLVLLEHSLSVRRSAKSVNQIDLAETLSNLGVSLFELGNHSKSIRYFEEALAVQRQFLPSNDIRIAKTLRHMGGCFAARGENERNRNLTKEAYSIAQASLDPDDPTFAYYLHDYGFSLAKMGKFSDGISLLQRSLILWKQQPQLPEFDRAIAKNLNFLGFALEEIGNISEALNCYAECLQLQKRIYHSNHPDLISTINNIGLIHCNRGEFEKAKSYLEDGLDICKASLPLGHPQTCAAAQNFGYCLVSLGHVGRAQQIAREMILVLSTATVPPNRDMIQCFQQLLVHASSIR